LTVIRAAGGRTGVPDGTPDALAGLLERGVREADDREPGQPGATSTSTRINRPSRPWSVADEDDGQHAPSLGRALTAGQPASPARSSRRTRACGRRGADGSAAALRDLVRAVATGLSTARAK
jgi:hypothetical protein